MKLFTCGTSALFAAALTLQAQTAGAGSAGTAGSTATPNTGASSQTMPSSSPQSSQFGTSSAAPSTGTSANAPQSSGSQFGSSSATASTSTQFGTAPANPTTPTGPSSGFSTSTPSTYGTQSFNANGSNSNFNNSNATNTNASASYNNSTTNTTTQTAGGGAGGYMTVNDGQVTTFVQQLDNMGPAVVTQLSTNLGDLACSQDTVQNLVDALHSGQSVTITSNVNGQEQSATFNPQGAHMSYGEAYLAIAMAAQELRDAGVTTCATPEQWNAVLMGGPLNVSSTSTTTNSAAYASNSRQVQGIVTLRNQGQGWGQIAQSANVQLGQVVNTSSVGQAGAPTGFSSQQMNHGRMDTNTQQGNSQQGMNATGQPHHKKHWWNRSNDKNSSSTHADTSSSQPDDSTSPQDNSSSQPGQ